MAYVVGTAAAAFCRGEDHPRSVPVTARGVPAGPAPESSFGQPGARLSLAALRAGHRGVGGRYQHHLAARPGATLDQFPLGRADRGVGGFARHRGPGQETGPDVLDRDGLVIAGDTLSPGARCVGVLPPGLFVQPGSLPPGVLVALGLGLAAPVPARHPALCPGQLGRAHLAVPGVGEIVGRVGGGGRGGDAPVDTGLPRVFRTGIS
jgi:hypothetical protein